MIMAQPVGISGTRQADQIADIQGLQQALDARPTSGAVDAAITAIELTPGPQGIPGIQGPQGDTGDTGVVSAQGTAPLTLNYNADAKAITGSVDLSGKADASALTAHVNRTDNPHQVTAAVIGALTQAIADGRYVLSGNSDAIICGTRIYMSGSDRRATADGYNFAFIHGDGVGYPIYVPYAHASGVHIGKTTLNSSAGTDYSVQILPSINQSGTAGYVALHIDIPSSISGGTGQRDLINAKYISVSKFRVQYDGSIFTAGFISYANGSFYTVGGVFAGNGADAQFGTNTVAKTILLLPHANQNYTTADNMVEIRSAGAGVYANTTGESACLKLQPAYNQSSGDASNYDLWINPTVTAVGSGGQYFIYASVGSAASTFSVTRAGVVQAAGYKAADGSAGATGSFTSQDGKTVTVKNGLITSIV